MVDRTARSRPRDILTDGARSSVWVYTHPPPETPDESNSCHRNFPRALCSLKWLLRHTVLQILTFAASMLCRLVKPTMTPMMPNPHPPPFLSPARLLAVGAPIAQYQSTLHDNTPTTHQR